MARWRIGIGQWSGAEDAAGVLYEGSEGQIVAESHVPGVNLAEVAQRRGVRIALVSSWRRQWARGGKGRARSAKFAVVRVSAPLVESCMEIDLAGGPLGRNRVVKSLEILHPAVSGWPSPSARVLPSSARRALRFYISPARSGSSMRFLAIVDSSRERPEIALDASTILCGSEPFLLLGCRVTE
jgi:transposase-like protein